MTGTPRQLAREQTMRDIVRIGREQLASVGPADLSLRAVARELGVVSSAVYRYVRSRDELLTLLIIDAYDEMADEVDAALADAPTAPRAQLHALASAVRDWAVREPSRYALLYGTPVPGYDAPAERTTEPGTRVVMSLIAILEIAFAEGHVEHEPRRLARSVRRDLDAIRREYALTMPADLLSRGFAVWSGLFGAVSFDVFGQYGPGTFSDPAAFFEHQVDALADLVGLS
ncbi:TetR/AcrR family transcriptional regulator [Aeromicrobium terrae]|uniref:TetR/AcrR family transcriptional regulator n=1 Tax=Aeromicrobium terrae TaxID=2498846 RepID=A0A5C8NGD8_9ACTN|nr:TetR/AcrR family transcriptional regulator [Aeromicrobium terrae]TXL57608.1 TetR/AcrR family transcriptional regulator [Aeromicrobium terrae]